MIRKTACVFKNFRHQQDTYYLKEFEILDKISLKDENVFDMSDSFPSNSSASSMQTKLVILIVSFLVAVIFHLIIFSLIEPNRAHIFLFLLSLAICAVDIIQLLFALPLFLIFLFKGTESARYCVLFVAYFSMVVYGCITLLLLSPLLTGAIAKEESLFIILYSLGFLASLGYSIYMGWFLLHRDVRNWIFLKAPVTNL